METPPCACVYIGCSFDLVLCDHHRKSVWDLGFYGSRPCDSVGKLTDYERLYLVRIGVLKRPLNPSTEPLAFESFLEVVCQEDMSKMARYKTYELLRDGGWVVRSGLNYGTDFVLYRSTPDTEHAEFAVVAIDGSTRVDTDMTWRRLLGINRSCVGAKKKLIVSVVNLEESTVRLLEVERWQPEAERMVPSQRLSPNFTFT